VFPYPTLSRSSNALFVLIIHSRPRRKEYRTSHGIFGRKTPCPAIPPEKGGQTKPRTCQSVAREKVTQRLLSVPGKREATGGALGAVSLSRRNGSDSAAIPLRSHFSMAFSGMKGGRETIAAWPQPSSAPGAKRPGLGPSVRDGWGWGIWNTWTRTTGPV